MNRYNNGKIYSIRSHQTDDVYIGSTCMPLSKRLYGHKDYYKSWLAGKQPYEYSAFKVIKYDDCYIELIEDYPCENKQQLHRREGELIRSMPCVNKMIPGRTRKEWIGENKEHIKHVAHQKYKKNREHILLQGKAYVEQNKEQVQQRQKAWYEKNKEHKKDIRHQRYEKIKADLSSVVMCEICNCQITMGCLTRHKQSKKHLHNLQG